MTKLTCFVGEYDGAPIRTTEDGRFSVFDVLVGFGVCDKSNTQKVLKRLLDRQPAFKDQVSYVQFPGRGQRKTPVAFESDLIEILGAVGCPVNADQVTSDKFYPRTETQIVSVLSEAFLDCQPCPQFFCGGYRIDLYLALPRIAIECDEHGHQAYKLSREEQRECSIKSSLGCSFIRFDPYDPTFNLGKIIKQIRELL